MVRKGLTSASPEPSEERHEWESFLGLMMALDVGQVDPMLYERCRAAVPRLRSQGEISRDELARSAGLDFYCSTFQFDLILARLVREAVMKPSPTGPFRFQLRTTGERRSLMPVFAACHERASQSDR
jgi:hypothetical protein